MLSKKNLMMSQLVVSMILLAGMPGISLAVDKITRQEIMNKAKAYANHKFHVSSDNITSSAGEIIGGKLVITPISKPGYYVGIPYKWGGNDSIERFQRGLDVGKKAGDKCISHLQNCQTNGTSSQAVGVDTSGFISQVWGLKHKYSTRTLPRISTQRSSMNELEPGDILLKPGRVMLFSHKNSGHFYVYEPSRRDWKVTLSSYTLSQLEEYQPYRYNEIVAKQLCAKCQDSEVSQLLRECDKHFKAFRLTMGTGGTAFSCYQQVLKKAPNNDKALAGLEKIEVYYFARIKCALDKKQRYEAQKYSVRLRKVNPNSPYLTVFDAQHLNDYEALIQKAAADTQLEPALLHAVIEVESNYNPNAVSYAGAMGLMQLMPATAKRFGVTNPYDPADNIKGGTRYLRYLFNLFKNDMELVLAAYNSGEGNVRKYGNTVPPSTQKYVKDVMRIYKTRTRR
jgi:hypothetical protein